MNTLTLIQKEMRGWQKHNFPNRGVHIPLLGMGEEIGELAHVSEDNSQHIVELCRTLGKLYHAHIKKEQGIRKNEDHDKNKKDAIADIMIYLIDYSNDHGYILYEILADVWAQVSSRDWVKFPKNGRDQ